MLGPAKAWAVFVCAAGVWTPMPVRGQGRVLILPPTLSGDLAERSLPELQETLREGCQRVSEELQCEVVSPEEMREGCDTGPPCLSELCRARGAQAVINATVESTLNYYTFSLRAFSPQGAVVAGISGPCDACTSAEAAQQLTNRAEELTRALPRDAVIRLQVSPPEAVVTVDGQLVTVGELTLSPGEHRLGARAEGFVAQELTLQVDLGERREVVVQLEAAPESTLTPASTDSAAEVERQHTPSPPESGLSEASLSRKWRRIGLSGAVFMGVGGVTALLAIPTLLINSTCAGGRRDPQGECEYIYQTTNGGIALLAAGTAVVVAGATMLVWRYFLRRRHLRREVMARSTWTALWARW